MSNDIDAGRKFNEAVGATGVVGGIRADLANVQKDVTEIKGDVKAMRRTIDRWGGAVALVSALVSIAVAVVVNALR